MITCADGDGGGYPGRRRLRRGSWYEIWPGRQAGGLHRQKQTEWLGHGGSMSLFPLTAVQRVDPAGTGDQWGVDILCGDEPMETSKMDGWGRAGVDVQAAQPELKHSHRWHCDVCFPRFENKDCQFTGIQITQPFHSVISAPVNTWILTKHV